jgi:predicted DNA-binding transcriptional regulator AlpA
VPQDLAVDLVGIAEIAQRLGVSYATVVAWRYRHRRQPRPPWQPFPSPIKTFGRSPVFNWAEVQAWAKATGRL